MFTLEELEQQKQCNHDFIVTIVSNFCIEYYALYYCKKCEFSYRKDITKDNYSTIFG